MIKFIRERILNFPFQDGNLHMQIILLFFVVNSIKNDA